MENRVPSTRFARCQCAFLFVVTSLPVSLYLGVVMFSVRQVQRENHGYLCPYGYLPCNESAEKVECIEERFWCDHKDHCPNGEDEDVQDCFEMFSFVHVFYTLGCGRFTDNHRLDTETFDDEEHDLPMSNKCDYLSYPAVCTCEMVVFRDADYSTVNCIQAKFDRVPEKLSPKLDALVLSRNNITTLYVGEFSHVPRLSKLFLDHNQLSGIQRGAFETLASLQSLSLEGNQLTTVLSGTFRGLTNLTHLSLKGNKLMTITNGTFHGLTNLRHLVLSDNRLRDIPPGAFDGLESLCFLSMMNNELTFLTNESLDAPSSLVFIELQHNRIKNIGNKLFSQLTNLQAIHISHNAIEYIDDNPFQQTSLKDLDLAHNNLRRLPRAMKSNGLSRLQDLSLAYNPIRYLDENPFSGLTNLKTLNLSEVRLEKVHRNSFRSLKRLRVIELHTFELCRYAPMVRVCLPRGDGISTIANLLDNMVLRVSIWIVAVTTCVGNGFVIVCRMLFREEKNVHSLFIKNLAVADFMMGVYLFLIATHDAIFRDQYNRHALTWMDSWGCRATGFLAMLSCEASVFLLVGMSVECCLAVSRPYRAPYITMFRGVVVLIAVWVAGSLLAGAPALSDRLIGDFYGSNGVCLPLHIHDPFLPGWQYSAAVFIGINSAAVITIAVSYAIMCFSVRTTSQASALELQAAGTAGGSAEVERTGVVNGSSGVAKRLFLIVLTDIACWIPVITIKVLAFANVRISDEFYAWLTVFVLPINSTLNPLIYTITTPRFRRKVCELCSASRRDLLNANGFRRLTCGCLNRLVWRRHSSMASTGSRRHSSMASTTLSLMLANFSTRRSQSLATGSRWATALDDEARRQCSGRNSPAISDIPGEADNDDEDSVREDTELDISQKTDTDTEEEHISENSNLNIPGKA